MEIIRLFVVSARDWIFLLSHFLSTIMVIPGPSESDFFKHFNTLSVFLPAIIASKKALRKKRYRTSAIDVSELFLFCHLAQTITCYLLIGLSPTETDLAENGDGEYPLPPPMLFALDSLPTAVFLNQTTTHLLLCSPPSNQSTNSLDPWFSCSPLMLILRLDRPSSIRGGALFYSSSFFPFVLHLFTPLKIHFLLTSAVVDLLWEYNLLLNIMNNKLFKSFHV